MDDDDCIIISIDSTGIKITTRGQWMDKKWNVQNKNIWSGYEELYAKDGLRTYVRWYNYTGDLSY